MVFIKDYCIDALETLWIGHSLVFHIFITINIAEKDVSNYLGFITPHVTSYEAHIMNFYK